MAERTLRDLIGDQELEIEGPENPLMKACLPGDDISGHPLIQSQLSNPFYGYCPLKVSRLLRSGKLSPQQESQARSWIDQYQKLSGDKVFDPRNHD